MAEFDVVVVGTGAGGLTVATEAKQRGAKVAMIGDDRPGGDCSYYGCVPTKTLIHSAKVLRYIRRASQYGLPEVNIEPDFGMIMAHKDRVVDEITAGGSWEPWEEKGFAVFKGHGRFVSRHEVQVNDTTVRGEKMVVAVGTRPAVPPIDGLEEAGYITNEDAVALKSLPRRIAVLGAGPVGLEFAQLFARLGAQVTVVEMAEQIAPQEDREVADRLEGYLQDEGIEIYTGVRVERVEKDGDAKVLVAEGRDGKEVRIEAVELLAATGREPKTDDLGLDAAGVELKDGWVGVDDTLRTSAANIWAVGDCTGKFLFTHVADYHAGIVAHNLFDQDDPKRTDYRVLPWVTFTDPEVARVGVTEAEARDQEKNVKVSRLDFSDVERAHMMLEQRGMIKVVADDEGRILGATVLGPHADDLIHEFTLAMHAELKAGDLAGMIHAYPTLSEAVGGSMEGLQ